MNTDPKNEQEREDNKGQATESPNEQKNVDDNEVQRGLTGEIDDEENVGGDLAGNASGNT
ncbi:hypothetical protein [Pedobacter sp. Leaf194]|uniref:hypothetical protein n=1 Tax=Pedobacter sp. Leaf194 TaxID=1736297 RepID=UPI000702B737|nr:hypothetical protein [Pedobacter sp. Leaf194]KQS36055.1 hypothetical protein ASG14_11495 [Pedobacter sp. Leaf194]